eukprot:Nk52_evm14s157 gene=Nk52_evmTU14s157
MKEPVALKHYFEWCTSYISGWVKATPADISIRPLAGGLTNLLYLVTYSKASSKSRDMRCPKNVLLRVYGGDTSNLFDRSIDNIIFTILSERKVGPYLYASFEEGRIEQFIESTTMLTECIQQPIISKKIAHEMAVFHAFDMPLVKKPSLHSMLDNFLRAQKPVTHPKGSKEAQLLAQVRSLINFEKEVEWLKKEAQESGSPLVFCHNDVQEGNILRLGKAEGEFNNDDNLQFIDYEYAGYNYRACDFGNHFCEWALNYSEKKFPFFRVNMDQFPTVGQQMFFFKEYLRKQNKPINPEVLQSMVEETKIGVLGSSLMWSIWAVLQSAESSIEFGYMEYSLARAEMYKKAKKAYLKGKEEGNSNKRRKTTV